MSTLKPRDIRDDYDEMVRMIAVDWPLPPPPPPLPRRCTLVVLVLLLLFLLYEIAMKHEQT